MKLGILLATALLTTPTPLASEGWSGYTAQADYTDPSSFFTSVSAAWIQPFAQCTSPQDLMTEWVGLGGWGQALTLAQTGTAVDCDQGTSIGAPRYYAWWRTDSDLNNPMPPTIYYLDPVAPFDHMQARVADNGDGTVTMSLSDLTQDWTEKKVRSFAASDGTAEAVIQSAGHQFPNFDTADFTNFLINDKNANLAHPFRLDAFDAQGDETETGPLDPNTWSFEIQYLHS